MINVQIFLDGPFHIFLSNHYRFCVNDNGMRTEQNSSDKRTEKYSKDVPAGH